MNKIAKKIFLFCLLSMFALTGLTACGNSEEGVEVSSANALARKLAKNSSVKIIVSEDIVLDEPIVVNGEKEIIGNGTITAAVEDGEELYMITVADGGKLTVRESVTIDANNLMGGIHVENGGSAIIQEEAVVKNATEETANALVEGTFEVAGGKLQDANGHNIYNKKETVVSGGEIIGSGSKYAGVYNEATLKQTGGTISKAYNNVSNVSGSTFTFEGGTNVKSKRDGVFVAEGATITATSKEATIEDAGARGIVLNGTGDIQNITVKDCADTLIKVGKQGVLNMAGGVLQEGNYHGVDNAGTFTMTGGAIQTNVNCGIVNTGTLKVTGGSISSNENKGILNKHAGKADVTSASVNLTSNKIAIGNEDNAVFEFANAKILMSTMTNIYCYDGTINLHDAALNASTSNNVRVIKGTINMKNVEVKGNSQKSGTSHHGIIMDGGVINAEDVTISMTTGCGMRVKGGTFIGKNIVMHDINRVAVSMGNHDYLEQEGLVKITGLEVQSTNYANVLNEGGGTIKITNAKLAVASSNSVRANGGRIELTNATIPGHKEGSKDNIHGFYLEGGEIVAKNITMKDIAGHALRNKNGKFVGTNITMTNIKGSSAISNAVLDDEHKNGIIEIDGLTIKDSFSKNLTLDCGVTTIKNATLGVTGGNNIKLQNNAATLNLYNVKVEGQTEDATASTHGIMVEGGNVYGENVQIYNTKASGIRCKLGVVDLKNVTMTDLGEAGISNGKMTKDGVELGAGEVKIDGLTITKAGTNNITLDAGTVDIINAELGKVETNNHNVKTMGSGVLTMENTKIYGTSNDTKYSIIAEGGDAELTNVEIYDSAKSGIHANKAASSVKGTNILISGAKYGLSGSKGSISIDGLTTEDVSTNNILAEGTLKVTVKNSTGEKGLGATPGHNVKAVDDALITLKKVDVKGVTVSGKHAVMAEGGDFVLKDVVIRDAADNGIRINTVTSSVKGENVTIINALKAVTGTYGTVTIDGLTTEGITDNNIFCGNDSTTATDDECVFTIKNATLSKPSAGHNVKASGANAKLVLETSEVNGVTASGKYGVIVEKAAELELNDVTIQDVKVSDVSAFYSNNAANVVTGTDVTITNSTVGVKVKAGTVEFDGLTVSNATNGVQTSGGTTTIDGLTTSDISNNNILAEGGNVTILNSEINAPAGHNMKTTAGTITLNNVKVLGVQDSSKHVLMAEGGNFDLTDVTITGSKNASIRINKATSAVVGTNVTITDGVNGITGTNGTVEIDGLTTSNLTGNNLLADTSCKITVSDSDLGKTTGGHNVKATGSAVITLTDAEIKGTSSGGHHAVMAEGGDFVLNNVEISGATAQDDRAAIRINDANSEIIGENITITDSSLGLSASAGKVNITGLTSSATVKDVDITGGNVTLTDVTADLIYATKAFSIGGKIKASIYNDEAVTVNAVSSLKGSIITLDWATDKMPTSLIAIQFASADDMQDSKGTVLLGENASEKYMPYYYGSQLLLNDKNNVQYTVKSFAELQEAIAEINDENKEVVQATITVTGDIVVTEEVVLAAGNVVRIQDDGTARTIKRSADYTKGNLFNVSAGAALTFGATGDNSNPTLKLDGGSKNETPVITEPVGLESSNNYSSLVKNSGTLTVGKGVQFGNAKGTEDAYVRALAIFAAEDSMTTFSGVMKSIEGQRDGYGIAVTVGKTQDFIISDAVIKDNYTLGIGIIRLESGGKLTITNSTFENNESVEEAGVISDSGNSDNRLTITGSTFKNNKTSGNGGVLVVSCGTQNNFVITDTTFVGNEANEGGAISIAGSGAITLDSCTFANNEAKRTTSDNVTTHWGNDVRVGGTNGKVTLKGKMDVTIFNRNKSVITVSDALEDGSKVVVDWSLDNKIPSDNVGIIFGSDDIMNASKEYISLGEMQNATYMVKYANAKATLVEPIKVYNESGLSDALATTGEDDDKIRFIKLMTDIDVTALMELPEEFDITITDNGEARTLKRATGYTGNLFKIPTTTSLTLISSSKDNANPTLIIDGGSKEDNTGIACTGSNTLLNNSGTLTVSQGVALQNNQTSGNNQGIALYSQAGSNMVFQGVLRNITSTYEGTSDPGAVSVKGTVLFKNAIVEDNATNRKGLIRVFENGSFSAVNTEFKDNTAGAEGGIININSGSEKVTLSDCTFTNNTATGNGGAIYNMSYNTEIINCKFNSNTSGGNGGAIYNGNGVSLTITGDGTDNSLFINNKANGEYGGAIGVGSGQIVVDGYKFDTNTAKKNGGAVYITGSNEVYSEITNSEFVNNTATNNNGGALYVNTSGRVTVMTTDFNNNQAQVRGGAVCSEGGTFSATNCNFTGNTAKDEGGAYRLANSGTGTLTGCTFTNNTAENTGGGAIKFNSGSLTIDGCTFTGNMATKGDANGHDIKLSTTTTKPIIKNSTFNASNVRDSEGTAGAYKDGGNNTLVTEE